MANPDSKTTVVRAAPPSPQIFVWSVAATLVMETVTCIMRFGLRMESTRDTSALAAITFNLRIHHSYLGVVGMLIGWFIWRRVNEKLGRWLVIIGIGAFASDMIHHFLVLWPIVGSPQFDFFYGLR